MRYQDLRQVIFPAVFNVWNELFDMIFRPDQQLIRMFKSRYICTSSPASAYNKHKIQLFSICVCQDSIAT